MLTKKIKIQKLNDEELKELDLHIDFLLESIKPITEQLINPRFCLTYEKARFTAGYEYKFGYGGKRYRTGNKLPPISSKEDIRNAILNSKHFKDYKKINIGLHSWNKNKNGESLVFIDIDNKKVLEGKAQEFKNNIKINSLTQTSASGGKHILVFVKSENELKNNYGMIPNVDLICRPQSYILAAGSTTAKGSYSLETTGDIASVDFKSISLLLTTAAAAIGVSGIESPESINEKWLSVEHEGENPKHQKERVYGHISQKTKNAFNKAFNTKTEIKQGQRMHFLRHVASKFLSSNTNIKQTQFLTFCCDINNEFFNPRLNSQEVEDFACSYQKEFYSSIRKFNSTVGQDLKSAMDSIKQSLLLLPKEEDHKNFIQCAIVDSQIQSLLEKLLNKKFKKNLPDGIVSKLLIESGFLKIQSWKKESRGIRFYNISASSLSSLLSSLPVGREEKSIHSNLVDNVGCSMTPCSEGNGSEEEKKSIHSNLVDNVGCSMTPCSEGNGSEEEKKSIHSNLVDNVGCSMTPCSEGNGSEEEKKSIHSNLVDNVGCSMTPCSEGNGSEEEKKSIHSNLVDNVGCYIGANAEHQASISDEQLNSEPATKPLHSHSDNSEQQTGIDSDKPECQSKAPQGSAEPATETKEQTLMNKQEPVETTLDNIQEQIIEALLEINKATDITPTQRKQYFVEVCDLINYSIWKDLPKHIENLIPRDQIIKIIRRN